MQLAIFSDGYSLVKFIRYYIIFKLHKLVYYKLILYIKVPLYEVLLIF